jgi:hypothetical protein
MIPTAGVFVEAASARSRLPVSPSHVSRRTLSRAAGVTCRPEPNRYFGFKIAYIGIRTQEDTGTDNDTFTIGCSLQW